MMTNNGKIEELLSQISDYVRELASHARRDELEAALKTHNQRAVYSLADGTRSGPEIRDASGIKVSTRTINRWLSGWVDSGLAERVEDDNVRARYVLLPNDATEALKE